ncbi:MAG: glycyl-radical enzyme activating protein [Firmicutes bacterium]|nr:glycyl-radical enzyme activating protein [Bacillota bacterium]
MKSGVIFNVERFAIHDGPGIRTVVFLKGCPLTCLWCANPEGQLVRPQLSFEPNDCLGCKECVRACPHEGFQFRNGEPLVLWDRCLKCKTLDCVDACPTGARKRVGQLTTPQEVLQQVLRDRPFFERSGGGLTLSGGEPLMQGAFTAELLRMAKAADINTCLETSGISDHPKAMEALELADFVFLDIKHMDSAAHCELVGRGNEQTLAVARHLSEMGKPVVVRIPLVPGRNDSQENVLATAQFARSIRSLVRLEILPYHRLGVQKYARIGRVYQLQQLEPPSSELVESRRKLVEGLDIVCKIV